MNRYPALSRLGPSAHFAAMARYAVVGLVNTTLDCAGYVTLATVMRLPAVVSNILSYSATILVSYLLNREWTFADRGRDARGWSQFGRFFCLNLIGLSLSTVIVFLFAMAVDKVLAKALSVPIVFFYNYFGSSRFVFRARQAGAGT